METFNGTSLRVLVIEDEPTIVEFLRVGLSYEHYHVTVAEDGPGGLALARSQAFDILILDVMLPGLDGFAVCRQLREMENNIPILMLTARREVTDRVAGLKIGADDYLTKPFNFEELLARVEALLRRRGKSSEQTLLRVRDLSLNPDTHEVYKGSISIDLSPLDFALLELFMRHPRRVFTRETLLNRIWGYEYVGDTNVVDVHIGHLRKEIGDPERRLIQTVYGVGYSFRPDNA
ncbi:MAG: response regulator transcription factor [Bacteroidota bacterium]